MLSFVPDIYPDELVYSWLCRIYVHGGYLNHKQAMGEFYRKRSDNPSVEFLGNLNDEFKALISTIRPLDELVLKHTMFPEYSRFISSEKKHKALEALKCGGFDAHHLFTILPRNTENENLRYCSLCAKEDKERYGETYWHREHQLRGVNICTKHSCSLSKSKVPMKTERSYTFYPADEHVEIRSASLCNDKRYKNYSVYINRCFDYPVSFEECDTVSKVLYNKIVNTKYIGRSGKCKKIKQLSDDLKEFYIGLGVSDYPSFNQVVSLFGGGYFEFSVVCQVACFLEISVKELLEPKVDLLTKQKENASHYIRNREKLDWDELDRKIFPKFEKVAEEIYFGNGERPERVSERLICDRVGIKAYQLNNLPKCKEVFDKYSETYEESWARKIVWACEQGCNTWTDIRKLTGVKKEKLSAVIPYVKKYADDDVRDGVEVMLKLAV